jgi:LysR family glycine cleavage system transcriptional activator
VDGSHQKIAYGCNAKMSFASRARLTHLPPWLRVVRHLDADAPTCTDDSMRIPNGRRREAEMARLPSLESLRIFAVAARHMSFTKAADELHLTQSAISHRVRALEEELGVTLFNRLTRRLELTPAGQALAQRVNHAVAGIARAVAELNPTNGAMRLTVTMGPSVASRLLVPRLPQFLAQNPDIEFQLISDPRLFDLRAAGVDLAIRFGRGTYPGYAVTKLMPDFVFPVCSPGFLAQHGPVATIEALLKLPLLHDSSTVSDDSGSDWRSWLDHFGRPEARCHDGQRFSDARLVIETAVHGLGVALARASLVADHMANGALVCPLRRVAPTAFAYYLVGLPEAASLEKIVRFSEWLQAQAAAMAAEIESPELQAGDFAEPGDSPVPLAAADEDDERAPLSDVRAA